MKERVIIVTFIRKRKKGFTLIEVMLVVLIIGTIAIIWSFHKPSFYI